MTRASRAARAARARTGFTLIEMLVAVVLLAILAGMATTMVGRSRSDAAEMALRAELAKVQAAMIEYRQDTGAYVTYGWGTAVKPNFNYTPPSGYQFSATNSGTYAEVSVKQVAAPFAYCLTWVGTHANAGTVTCAPSS